MNKRKIASIISIILSILFTAILPPLLTNIIPLEYYPLAIIVTVFMAVSLILIYLLLNPANATETIAVKKQTTSFTISQNHPEIASISHINKLRIYAITTTNIAALFETSSFTVNECVILLRYTPSNAFYHPMSYENEIIAKISRWKHMVDIGKIKQLTIIGYDNLPDNWFFAFDDKLLATGLVEFSSSDICGQSMSKIPSWFYNNDPSSDSAKQIQIYLKHFDNFVKYYSQYGFLFVDKYTRD